MGWLSTFGRSVRNLISGGISTPAGYDGASTHRRLSGFRTTNAHINVLLAGDGAQLRDRSRDLIRNNSYAKAARRSFAANVVGTGIRTGFRHPEDGLGEELRQLWEDHSCWQIDADGVVDYYGLQALIAKVLFTCGEAFARRVNRKLSDGLAVPLQVQLIDPAQLPLWKMGPLDNGNVIRCGIEFDPKGQRVAYWFLKRNPGDWTALMNDCDPELFMRIPASEVLHIFEPEEIGQIRGEPRMASCLADFFLLGEYDSAELDRKKVAAMFAGFILEDSAENVAIEGAVGEDGIAVAPLEAGTLQVLNGAKDIKFSDPADVGGSYDAFEYRNLTKGAAGAGVPYMAMTGDLKSANYSSMRAGSLEYRRQIEQTQWHGLIAQFCRPVARWWLETAVLAGMVSLKPADYRKNPAYWLAKIAHIPPRFDWVDPLKDVKAEIMSIDAGIKARSQSIEEQGYSADEVDARRAEDKERADRLGVPVGLGLPNGLVPLGPDGTEPNGTG